MKPKPDCTRPVDTERWESDKDGREWCTVKDNGQGIVSDDITPVWLEDTATDIPALDKIASREGWMEEAVRLWEIQHANQLSAFKRPSEIYISIGKGIKESSKSLGSCHYAQNRDASYIYIRSDRHDASDSIEVLSTLFHDCLLYTSPSPRD